MGSTLSGGLSKDPGMLLAAMPAMSSTLVDRAAGTTAKSKADRDQDTGQVGALQLEVSDPTARTGIMTTDTIPEQAGVGTRTLTEGREARTAMAHRRMGTATAGIPTITEDVGRGTARRHNRGHRNRVVHLTAVTVRVARAVAAPTAALMVRTNLLNWVRAPIAPHHLQVQHRILTEATALTGARQLPTSLRLPTRTLPLNSRTDTVLQHTNLHTLGTEGTAKLRRRLISHRRRRNRATAPLTEAASFQRIYSSSRAVRIAGIAKRQYPGMRVLQYGRH